MSSKMHPALYSLGATVPPQR